ncbi:MAG: WG repeat-containing protein, partial [Prevotella sp.]|nr:WG repeat-containing protein [Prevotella sp.]
MRNIYLFLMCCLCIVHPSCQKQEGFGVVDSEGKIIVPMIYDEVDPLTNEVLIALKDSKYALINAKGKKPTSFIYDDISFLSRRLGLFFWGEEDKMDSTIYEFYPGHIFRTTKN